MITNRPDIFADVKCVGDVCWTKNGTKVLWEQLPGTCKALGTNYPSFIYVVHRFDLVARLLSAQV